ncbi:helix-turn-helix domain-containing protein [Brucella thiophenivorans]|uniref:helix-turn-helix domain-containing protein n=1 Tax=Brucella thiophenivorans TaxID=571255 RepID=UPI000B983D63|nr:helix-turn-helix transcriptional regulator [Brucella thiophenivorans]
MTEISASLPTALQQVRKAKNLSQEAFSEVSSRTYMSSLERGLKSPTLKKIEGICSVLNVHPLTLLTLAYSDEGSVGSNSLLNIVKRQIEELEL